LLKWYFGLGSGLRRVELELLVALAELPVPWPEILVLAFIHRLIPPMF